MLAVIAFALFLLAGVGVHLGNLNLIALGLAALSLAILFGSWPFGSWIRRD